MADGDGRHRAGRQSRRRQVGRSRHRRPDARQDLSRRRSPSGTIRRSRRSTRRSTLPDLAIAVIHRADGSGTTFNFTNYLAKVSPEWEAKIGEATSVEWPVGIGAKGNDGVANNVAGTKGAIGYVEYAYAKQNNLTYADMVNKAGKTVAPTDRSLPGRRRQRRLGQGARLLPDPVRTSRASSPGR